MYNVSQKLDYLSRMILPALTTVILLLLTMLPMGMSGIAYFLPDICLISIYYWSIFRPSTMPFWFLFLLGILRDALFGSLLGLSSLVFIFFRVIVLMQQRYLFKETFTAMWFSFAGATALGLLLLWMLASAYSGTLLSLEAAFMQWVFTCGAYPLAHSGFGYVYKHLPPQPISGKTQGKLLF